MRNSDTGAAGCPLGTLSSPLHCTLNTTLSHRTLHMTLYTWNTFFCTMQDWINLVAVILCPCSRILVQSSDPVHLLNDDYLGRSTVKCCGLWRGDCLTYKHYSRTTQLPKNVLYISTSLPWGQPTFCLVSHFWPTSSRSSKHAKFFMFWLKTDFHTPPI